MKYNIGWMYALFAYLCWGLLPVVGKKLLEFYSPFTLNSIRLIFSTLILFIFLTKKDKIKISLSLKTDKRVYVLGLAGLGITFTLYTFALKYTMANYVMLFIYLSPIFTYILSTVILKEKRGKYFIPCLLLSMVGTYMAIFGTERTIDILQQNKIGLFLALLSSIFWSYYTVKIRSLSKDYNGMQLTFVAFFIGAIYFTLFAIFYEQYSFKIGLNGFLWMALYILIPTILAYLLYNRALQTLTSQSVSVMMGIQLLATIFASFIILNEKVEIMQSIGYTVVILSISFYIYKNYFKWTMGN